MRPMRSLLSSLGEVRISVDDGAGLGDALAGGLGAQEQARGGVLGIADRRGERLGPDAARGPGDALGQVDVIALGGAGLGQGAAEDAGIGQQLVRDDGQVKAEIQVGDAVGGQIVEEQIAAREGAQFRGDGPVLGGQVGHGQARNGLERFGRVGLGLEALELGRVVDDRLDGLRRQGLLGSLEPVGLGLGLGPGQLLVGLQEHGGAVRVVQEKPGQQFLEDLVAVFQPRLDVGQRFLEGQQGQGIALVFAVIVEPGGQGLEHERQAARIGAGVVLAQGELHGVDGRLDVAGVDAVLYQFLDGVEDDRLHLDGVGRVHALESHGEEHLAHVGFQAHARQVVAQAGVGQGFLQRRTGQADKDVLQDVQGQVQVGVRGLGQQPVDREHAFGQPVRGRVALAHGLGLGETRLERHAGLGHVDGLVLREDSVQNLQALFRLVVAVEEGVGVGRVVVVAVEGHELVEGQVRDDRRIAARVQAVGGLREQGLLGVFVEQGVGRGIRALHLVEDHTFVGHVAVRGFELVVPALLLEGVLGQARVEDRVQVDVHEVVEVLHVGRGHGIAGLVRKGQGVQEGLERSLEQFHERLAHRVLVRAAEHRVLQDVGHARGILGRRAERDAEDLVLVVVDHGQDARARLVVAVDDGRAGQLRDFHFPYLGEAESHKRSLFFCIRSCAGRPKPEPPRGKPRYTLP